MEIEEPAFELVGEAPAHNGRTFPGRGRQPGSKNKASEVVWRMARAATPAIMNRMIERAQKLADDIDFKCAQVILGRTWPRQRGAPIQINIDNREAIVAALANGDLTPGDAAGLLRNERLLPAPAVDESDGKSARDRLADRLVKAVESRPMPEPQLPPELTKEQLTQLVGEMLKKELEGKASA